MGCDSHPLVNFPLSFCGLRCGARALFFDVFLEALFLRFFAVWGGFGEVFGSQNGCQNQLLEGVFAMFFSNAFRYRFWVAFGS